MSYTMIALILAGSSAVVLKLLAYFVFGTKKPNEILLYLEKYMPLLIMIILVCFLYKGLDYSKSPYSLEYIFAGFLALVMQMIIKKSYISIIFATGVFYYLHEVLL